MIKYLGSKRKLTDALTTIALALGTKTALDAFTGTTRVAQAFKKAGIETTASDIATYSKAFADCYIATDKSQIDEDAVKRALVELSALPGERGYFTKTFCEDSRFFKPKNGVRVDAMRNAIDDYPEWLRPILLTSLIEAADRVDSTTGIQMAYLKEWAPRADNDLELRVPELIDGIGHAYEGDVVDVMERMRKEGITFDLVYMDPPYNQHRYYTNYHIWETLTRWDAPESYGVACKRIDAKDERTKSDFNKKREFAGAFKKMLTGARAISDTAMVSYNDDTWLTREEITSMLLDAGYEDVCVLEYEWDRYVGARIGIYDPSGKKVGKVGATKNHELVFVAAPKDKVSVVKSINDQNAASSSLLR